MTKYESYLRFFDDKTLRILFISKITYVFCANIISCAFYKINASDCLTDKVKKMQLCCQIDLYESILKFYLSFIHKYDKSNGKWNSLKNFLVSSSIWIDWIKRKFLCYIQDIIVRCFIYPIWVSLFRYLFMNNILVFTSNILRRELTNLCITIQSWAFEGHSSFQFNTEISLF